MFVTQNLLQNRKCSTAEYNLEGQAAVKVGTVVTIKLSLKPEPIIRKAQVSHLLTFTQLLFPLENHDSDPTTMIGVQKIRA